MAGKSYSGTPPIERYEEAKSLCDQWMALEGYAPCHERYQQTALMAIDSGVVHRLYTMHPDRNTKHGGVSVGLSKTEIMKDTWTQHVKFQIETALQREIK